MITLTDANKCDMYPVFKGKTPYWYGTYETLCHCPILMYFGESTKDFDSKLEQFGKEFLPEHLSKALSNTLKYADEKLEDLTFKTSVTNVGITQHGGLLVYRVYFCPQEYSEELDVHECNHLAQFLLMSIAEESSLDSKAARELEARLTGKYYHIVREIKRLIFDKHQNSKKDR